MKQTSKTFFISFTTITLIIIFTIDAQAQIFEKLCSPDQKCIVQLETDSSKNIFFNLYYLDSIIFENSQLEFEINGEKHCNLNTDTLVNIDKTTHNEIIESQLAERKFQNDCYNQYILNFSSNKLKFNVEIRIYNNAFAIRYSIKNDKVCDFADITKFNTNKELKFDYYLETRNESGYKIVSSKSSQGICPAFFYNDNLYCIINEAANKALAPTAKIKLENGNFTFDQHYSKSNVIKTSFRYIIFAETAIKMLENKYVIYSLNIPTDTSKIDYSFIKSGTVFRYIPLKNNDDFNTDEAKKVVDFCQKYNIKYTLFDAGWYGLGYKQEHNSKSDPFKTVNNMNIKEIVNYAKEKNVGIILYVNKTAWNTYNNKQLLDTLAFWGVAGIKMGYMSSNTMSDIKKIYSTIQLAAERKIFVNVHDNFRPSGVETNLKNLLTAEGIRGNEYTNNSAFHTMLLPFTRFMTGAADYTICYPGYPPPNYNQKMITTKGHQLALSIIFFSPLQHILWYSKINEYNEKPFEIEFFNDLPTVWDDYKILEAVPSKYFSILRLKNNKWYFATATTSARETTLTLDFIRKKKRYTAKIFEDDENNSIKITQLDNLKKVDTLNFKLKSSSGATAIFEKKVKHKKSSLFSQKTQK